MVCAHEHDTAFDFVGDVGYDLYGFAEVVASSFFFDDAFVYASGGDVVVLACVDVEESFVVSEVEVGFGSVFGDVAFAVFVGVEGAWVDVEVGVEFLDCDIVAAALEELGQRCGDDSFAEGRCYTARYEHVPCFGHFERFIW